MLKSLPLKRSYQTSTKSKKQQLTNEIKNHLAWKGDISLCEAASLLNNCEPFTYVLSSGMDQDHFILSFVDVDRVVKHRNVRILIDRGDWKLKNGASVCYESIILLIPNCLHCSSNICKPLV